jgi:hypothetical protein
MDRVERSVIVDDVDHLNESPTLPAAYDKVFVITNVWGITTAGVARQRFDLRNSAPMFCRVLKVPIVPAEPLRHQYYIIKPVDVFKRFRLLTQEMTK